MNQFINTFTRQVMRSAVQIAMAFGIKKGIDALANRGKDPEQMTPEEKAAASKTQRNAKEAMKRLRQASRITRKFR